MIDLKIPKKTKKERDKEMIGSYPNEDQYPWGARLDFNKEEIDKIKALKTAKAGDKVSISAIGKITRVEVTDAENGRSRHQVQIQVQKIEISNNDPGDEQKAFEEK